MLIPVRDPLAVSLLRQECEANGLFCYFMDFYGIVPVAFRITRKPVRSEVTPPVRLALRVAQ